jgi:hypothetical protein
MQVVYRRGKFGDPYSPAGGDKFTINIGGKVQAILAVSWLAEDQCLPLVGAGSITFDMFSSSTGDSTRICLGSVQVPYNAATDNYNLAVIELAYGTDYIEVTVDGGMTGGAGFSLTLATEKTTGSVHFQGGLGFTVVKNAHHVDLTYFQEMIKRIESTVRTDTDPEVYTVSPLMYFTINSSLSLQAGY